MVNIKFFYDSRMFHLTPRNQEGFDVPDELWNKYLQCRRMLNMSSPYYRGVLSDILRHMDERKKRIQTIDSLATVDKNKKVC